MLYVVSVRRWGPLGYTGTSLKHRHRPNADLWSGHRKTCSYGLKAHQSLFCDHMSLRSLVYAPAYGCGRCTMYASWCTVNLSCIAPARQPLPLQNAPLSDHNHLRQMT